MLVFSIHSFGIKLSFRFVHEASDFNGVDSDHRCLGALKVDSHKLLTPLLLEMCSGVGE